MRSANLLRPPFHIPRDIAKSAWRELSRQHDHFFRLCRTISAVTPTECFNAMLLYKDLEGWYLFGEAGIMQVDVT
jgi:hypothetical protein